MAFWRMSFRVGNQGQKMWPQCYRYGVAAITYAPILRLDLAAYPKGEPKEIWGQLESSQKASIRRLVHEMRIGDVIYVKEGPRIIAKGTVTGPYRYDPLERIVDTNGNPWAHQVPVDWAPDFPTVELLLGAEQFTVKDLTAEDAARIEAAAALAVAADQDAAMEEGSAFKAEVEFRERNRNIVSAKKIGSDLRCEACEMRFDEVYGDLGAGYIVAHHLYPISQGSRRTTLDDLALVCANCHAMVHRRNPPMPIAELRAILASVVGLRR